MVDLVGVLPLVVLSVEERHAGVGLVLHDLHALAAAGLAAALQMKNKTYNRSLGLSFTELPTP